MMRCDFHDRVVVLYIYTPCIERLIWCARKFMQTITQQHQQQQRQRHHPLTTRK